MLSAPPVSSPPDALSMVHQRAGQHQVCPPPMFLRPSAHDLMRSHARSKSHRDYMRHSLSVLASIPRSLVLRCFYCWFTVPWPSMTHDTLKQYEHAQPWPAGPRCVQRPSESAHNAHFQRIGHMAAFRRHHADIAVQACRHSIRPHRITCTNTHRMQTGLQLLTFFFVFFILYSRVTQ